MIKFVSQMMDFVLKMMNLRPGGERENLPDARHYGRGRQDVGIRFVLGMMSSAFKMMNPVVTNDELCV